MVLVKSIDLCVEVYFLEFLCLFVPLWLIFFIFHSASHLYSISHLESQIVSSLHCSLTFRNICISCFLRSVIIWKFCAIYLDCSSRNPSECERGYRVQSIAAFNFVIFLLDCLGMKLKKSIHFSMKINLKRIYENIFANASLKETQ